MANKRYNINFTHTLERDGIEFDVEVFGVYTKGAAATYWEPEDGGDFELTEVLNENGKSIELTEDEEEKLAQYGYEIAEGD